MKKQNGFGLLEILITLVLLGVGVAGLVALARTMLDTAQEGRRYEKAMRLAESEIDGLRNFNGVVALASGATGTLYKDIVSGSRSSQTLPGDISGDSYDLNRYVCNQYWNGEEWWPLPPLPLNCPAGATNPDRKVVTVEVKWSDNGGVSRYLQLAGAISPTGSFTSEETGDGLVKHRDGPKVKYTPGAAPDVISVELGGGRNQETSKPSPTVSSKKDSISKEVQFETVAYQPEDATQQVRQDILTVSCTCRNGASQTSYLPGQAYSTSTNQLYWKMGALQSKQTGIVDGDKQPTLCGTSDNGDMSKSSCCRDHFDGSGSSFANYYAPRYAGHQRDNIAAGNGLYLDACRFVRLDGFYRPLPDWNLVKVVVTSKDFLVKTKNQLSYQNYIQYVVKAYVDWQKQTLKWPTGVAQQGAAAPLPPLDISEFADWLATNATVGGDTTTGITINTGTHQLIARGIYVDILDPAYLAKINTSVSGYLAKVPFQDINLTMLAEWTMTPLSGQLDGVVTDYAAVSNEPINTILDTDNYYFGKYSRGDLNAKNSTKNTNQELQSVKVKATVYQGNSGVTATLVSSRDQQYAISSELGVKIDTGAVAQPPLTVTGKIQCLIRTANNDRTPKACADNDYNKLSISPQISLGMGCTINAPTSAGQIATYSCTAAQDSTLVVNFSHSGTNPTFQFNPTTSLSIPMTPPLSGDLTFSGPCILLVDNGVTNAANLTCSP